MSFGPGGYKEALDTALTSAGLPTKVQDIIGRTYIFACERGSHHHVLSGTITAMKISDEGGLDLFVTNPSIWGTRLISLRFIIERWAAFIEVEPLEPMQTPDDREELTEAESEEEDARIEAYLASRFLPGEFQLL